MANWKSYTKIIPNTAEERAVAKQMEAEENARYEEAQADADLAWTATSGQQVRVYRHGQAGEFLVIVDGEEHHGCTMQTVSAKHQAAGISAKLGPVGLTAERKAALDKLV